MPGRAGTTFSIGKSIRRIHRSSGKGGERPARADGWRRKPVRPRTPSANGDPGRSARGIGGGFSWTFAPSLTLEGSYATPVRLAVATQRHWEAYTRLTFRPLLMFPKVAAAQ